VISVNIYRNISDIPFDENTVLTVGSFDGLHLGHKSILERLKEISKSEGLRNLLITFDPHPQIFFKRADRPALKLLTTTDEKISILEEIGIENLLILKFDKKFAQTSARNFIQKYLLEQVGMKKILIGYDHSFGKNRGGDVQLLKEIGENEKFEVEKIDAFGENERIFSSSEIRLALLGGDLKSANSMLGRPYSILGKVKEGEKRGRTIGYPTANIYPQDENKLILNHGVYAISSFYDNKILYGMANIGVRPTFENDEKRVIEVNFFDFSGNIYDEFINISFYKFIREEIKFESTEKLISQIKSDEIECRRFLRIIQK
jgi:riboflavin kinase / FMN adenylyltransferase